MASLLDEVVITDGNKMGFELILNAGRPHDQPVHVFIWGPQGSGKSKVLQARGREKDLLSTRRLISAHGQEILASLNSGVNDEFLDELGVADVLLVDGFDTLFDTEIGTSLAKLLLKQRNGQGLDTIVVSDKPMSALDVSAMDHALDDYVEVEVAPLDEDGLVELASRVQEGLRKADETYPVLDDEALRFVAVDFADTPDDIRNAMRFLLTKTELKPNSQIDKALASELLGR